MRKRTTIEDKLDDLAVMPIASNTSEALAQLRPYLKDKNNRVVAMAARLCADHLIYDSVKDLVNACRTFMCNGEKTDKNCLAKKALCQALYALDFNDRDFYLHAISYRQMEPVWGGSVDTAADVRITCAQGLTLSGDFRVAADLLPLLYDELASVRIGAVKAVALLPSDRAELVLRQKVLQGDEEPGVVGECFNSLLTVEPDLSVEFVARYLNDADEAVIQEAAMALGIASSPDSWQALHHCWRGRCLADTAIREVIRGMALHRLPQAQDFLLEVVAGNRLGMAGWVLEMLYQYRNTEKIRSALAKLLSEPEYRSLQTTFFSIWR
ncbi:MAG: hypothetical protein H6999_10870 [Hahellaceae bacterium]|nr:hypothetical protein [Hahellaceae bacterium]